MAIQKDSYLLVTRIHFADKKSYYRYVDLFQKVIKRHDIFRTSLFWERLSEPAQVLWNEVPSICNRDSLHQGNIYSEDHNTILRPNYCKLDLTKAPLL